MARPPDKRSVDVDDDLYEQAGYLAGKRGVKITNVVRDALKSYLYNTPATYTGESEIERMYRHALERAATAEFRLFKKAQAYERLRKGMCVGEGYTLVCIPIVEQPQEPELQKGEWFLVPDEDVDRLGGPEEVLLLLKDILKTAH